MLISDRAWRMIGSCQSGKGKGEVNSKFEGAVGHADRRRFRVQSTLPAPALLETKRRSCANGSTFLEVSKANFRPIMIVAPRPVVFEASDRLARPAYRKIVANECKCRTLATLRGILLPKFISGDLRAKDVEIFVEENL